MRRRLVAILGTLAVAAVVLVVRSGPVDLREVVLYEVERAGSRARVRLATAGVAAATVHGDREGLARG